MTTFSQMRKQRAELDALHALAEREYRAGRLAEAAAAFNKILALRPDIAEAHNNLGSILRALGKPDQALERYRQAVALKPAYPEAHFNLGNLFLSQGNLDEAAARYEHAIALRPSYAEAHNNLGNVLCTQGKLDEALAHYKQAVALRPDYAEAHNSVGNVFKEQGKFDQATACYQQAIALRPEYAEAHNNLGVVLWQQDKLDQAAARLEQAVALRPDYAEAHNNLGVILWQQEKLDQAHARIAQALALRPDFADAHNNLGNVLKDQGQLDQAAASYQQALALRPDHAKAHNNLGSILRDQGKLDEAQARYLQALALMPNYAEAHYNLGNALKDQGKLEAATARYNQALALKPDFADAQLALATRYLVEEDYQRGWPGYEARLRMPGFLPRTSLPRWQGEPLAGRSLLLLAEQGLGDTIHFIRYARLLKREGARVVLACPPPLRRLLASHPDLDELFILGSGALMPHCDFYLPLLSAPGAFRTDASTIPCEIPYLSADPELTEAWRQELAAIDGFKIAITWQGSRDYGFDRWRSIPLAQFAPLARLPGVRLISLQKGYGSEQIAAVDFPVLDLSDRLDAVAGPFMDTAAVIRGVDLVVSANTAIAHLAGALGAPVWIALQFSPDWRWLLNRDDSPWYPTMRLFRQTAFGEWSDVFERIAQAVLGRLHLPATPNV